MGFTRMNHKDPPGSIIGTHMDLTTGIHQDPPLRFTMGFHKDLPWELGIHQDPLLGSTRFHQQDPQISSAKIHKDPTLQSSRIHQ